MQMHFGEFLAVKTVLTSSNFYLVSHRDHNELENSRQLVHCYHKRFFIHYSRQCENSAKDPNIWTLLPGQEQQQWSN